MQLVLLTFRACRAGMEAVLSPGAEGLLCTPEGLLLEGLVTNVFLVRGVS